MVLWGRADWTVAGNTRALSTCIHRLIIVLTFMADLFTKGFPPESAMGCQEKHVGASRPCSSLCTGVQMSQGKKPACFQLSTKVFLGSNVLCWGT